MYFQSIVLHCHEKMQQERSISATYYLLQGKPSIQTIQDGQIYQLNNYLGIYKKLSKDRFFEIVNELIREKLIQKQVEENYYQVTDVGRQLIKKFHMTPNYLAGNLYKDIDLTFYQRMLLFIQVFTNSKMNHHKYIPIIDNKEVETWNKSYYRQWKSNPNDILATLYDELTQILSPLENQVAEIFVDQLTGYKRVGLTMEQIAQSLQTSVESVHMIHMNTIHYFLKEIQSKPEKYELLHTLSYDLFQQSSLTKSALMTEKLMNKGYSMTEIANKRQLQLNTIYDHVVEIAVKNRNFSITPFVSNDMQQEILLAIQKVKSYKLKDIKDYVGEEVSYFQIRLVIAKLDE